MKKKPKISKNHIKKILITNIKDMLQDNWCIYYQYRYVQRDIINAIKAGIDISLEDIDTYYRYKYDK